MLICTLSNYFFHTINLNVAMNILKGYCTCWLIQLHYHLHVPDISVSLVDKCELQKLMTKIKNFYMISVKGVRSYFFFKITFLFNLKNHNSKDVNFKFQLKRSSRLDVRSNFVYIADAYILYYVSLITVTLTRHVFTNIFKTARFSPVTFAMGYELSCDSKISKILKKKLTR